MAPHPPGSIRIIILTTPPGFLVPLAPSRSVVALPAPWTSGCYVQSHKVLLLGEAMLCLSLSLSLSQNQNQYHTLMLLIRTVLWLEDGREKRIFKPQLPTEHWLVVAWWCAATEVSSSSPEWMWLWSFSLVILCIFTSIVLKILK